jgi:hypothetical protein
MAHPARKDDDRNRNGRHQVAAFQGSGAIRGDATANMRIVSLNPPRFRIAVLNRIGANGPVRATTDLLLVRQ